MKNKQRNLIFIITFVVVFGGASLFYLFSKEKDEPLTFETKPALIDMDDGYDGFEGWGTSLAWWGHIIGQWEDDETFDTLMDLIFDEEKGLGLNIVRYNIGGGENPDIPNTLRPGGDVPGFQPEENEWDWEADSGQRRVMLEGIKRGVDITEAFSNSPPYWMTISKTVTGAEDGGDNLHPDYFDAFADYLTEVVKYYDDVHDVTFRTLNPLNEPNSDWWRKGGGQEGSHFSLDNQMRIIQKVHQSLQEKGITETSISGPDTFSVDETLANIKNYDEKTLSILSQINTHAYSGMQHKPLQKQANKLEKKLWMSEFGAGGTEAHNHQDMTSVMQLAERVIIDLRMLQPDAWVYWQAVEDEGAQNNWGFIHSNFNSSKENYVLTKQYYAMANFTKYIRPGSRILFTTDGRSVAAYNEEQKQLSIVVRNEKSEQKVMEYDLSSFNYPSRQAHMYVTTLDKNLEQEDLKIYSNGFQVELEAESISTIVIKDVELK